MHGDMNNGMTEWRMDAMDGVEGRRCQTISHECLKTKYVNLPDDIPARLRTCLTCPPLTANKGTQNSHLGQVGHFSGAKEMYEEKGHGIRNRVFDPVFD